jgi:hypothetical protein
VTNANSFTVAGDQTGAPIRLADFRPVACEKLVRVGSANDGGYVVPLAAVEAADALLSFGLSHDWTFERDFKRRNPRALIHCYDHTVTVLSAFQYSIGQFARFALRFDTRYLRRSFVWLDYLYFFRDDRIHFRQRIWHGRDHTSVTVADSFALLPVGAQVFVKIDIEGSEYRILDDLLAHRDHIVALTIEFHDVDIVTERFEALVSKIKNDFYIVHIHGNNLGGLTRDSFPIAPEITFLHKRFFSEPPPPSRAKYPVPGLDSPNYPGFPEIALEF